MSEEVKVVRGTKVEPAEAEKLDYAEIGYTLTGPPPEEEPDVEGQAWFRKWVQCPWCYRHSWINYDSSRYHNYRCCHCGNIFRM